MHFHFHSLGATAELRVRETRRSAHGSGMEGHVVARYDARLGGASTALWMGAATIANKTAAGGNDTTIGDGTIGVEGDAHAPLEGGASRLLEGSAPRVQEGGALGGACAYNTSETAAWVIEGSGAHDEMCNVFLLWAHECDPLRVRCANNFEHAPTPHRMSTT